MLLEPLNLQDNMTQLDNMWALVISKNFLQGSNSQDRRYSQELIDQSMYKQSQQCMDRRQIVLQLRQRFLLDMVLGRFQQYRNSGQEDNLGEWQYLEDNIFL